MDSPLIASLLLLSKYSNYNRRFSKRNLNHLYVIEITVKNFLSFRNLIPTNAFPTDSGVFPSHPCYLFAVLHTSFHVFLALPERLWVRVNCHLSSNYRLRWDVLKLNLWLQEYRYVMVRTLHTISPDNRMTVNPSMAWLTQRD
jgi:hypothetical protein